VHDLAFVVRITTVEASFYGLGSSSISCWPASRLRNSRILSKEETLEHLPTLKQEGLRGGAVYYDGQFDDARLLIHMVGPHTSRAQPC